jgi:two-component system chemotaxis response regulator CheY
MGTKVLVIDDSTLIRRQVAGALTTAGFSVVESIDGLDALQRLAANPDTRLIFCDLNMPGMNGIEFLEQLGARGCTIAVIMLSSDGQLALVDRAKALGAKAWLTKPFKPELLVAAARKLTGSTPPQSVR